MSLTNISCGSCGVAFCLPTEMYTARRKDGAWFHCPNGHQIAYRPSENEKRIKALEEEVARRDRRIERDMREFGELYAAREELIAELKRCPGHCGWHSRKQVPRDPIAMGRGLERVRLDVVEHLITEHGVGVAQRLLEAGS